MARNLARYRARARLRRDERLDESVRRPERVSLPRLRNELCVRFELIFDVVREERLRLVTFLGEALAFLPPRLAEDALRRCLAYAVSYMDAPTKTVRRANNKGVVRTRQCFLIFFPFL
jgi:hypothetical protein